MAKSLLNRLDACPPFMAFAIFLNRRTRPTMDQVVNGSGLSKRTFSRIAAQLSWSQVRASQIDMFCAACGVNPFNLERPRDYLKRRCHRQWKHLTTIQQEVFRRQCARYILLKERATASV